MRATLPPGTSVAAVGYSMGANMLCKAMGERRLQLEAAILVSNPWDFMKLSNKMEGLPNVAYSVALCSWIKSNIFDDPSNRDVMRQLAHVDLDAALEAKTIRELDDRLTRKFYPNLPTVEQYYNVSSSRPFVSHVTTPTLCLNAMDDPIIDNERALPFEESKQNPRLILATTKHGGHCAWSDGPFPDSSRSFLTRVLFEYVEAAFARKRGA